MNAHKIELRGGGELSRLHRLFDLSGAKLDLPFSSCVALDTLAEKWLGLRLDKSMQNGKEWDGPLTPRHYICMSHSCRLRWYTHCIIQMPPRTHA